MEIEYIIVRQPKVFPAESSPERMQPYRLVVLQCHAFSQTPVIIVLFRMQTVCQDFLEALDHFEEMLEKVERDLGLFES